MQLTLNNLLHELFLNILMRYPKSKKQGVTYWFGLTY